MRNVSQGTDLLPPGGSDGHDYHFEQLVPLLGSRGAETGSRKPTSALPEALRTTLSIQPACWRGAVVCKAQHPWKRTRHAGSSMPQQGGWSLKELCSFTIGFFPCLRTHIMRVVAHSSREIFFALPVGCIFPEEFQLHSASADDWVRRCTDASRAMGGIAHNTFTMPGTPGHGSLIPDKHTSWVWPAGSLGPFKSYKAV